MTLTRLAAAIRTAAPLCDEMDLRITSTNGLVLAAIIDASGLDPKGIVQAVIKGETK